MANIMIDIDGVLARWVEGFTRLARTHYGTTPITRTEEQPSWDGFEGMTSGQIAEIWSKLTNDRSFWRNLEPAVTNDVFDRIDELTGKANVYFITSRVGVECKRQTEQWLMAMGVYYPTVILSHRKASVAQAIGIQYGLEDQLNNAINMSEMGVKMSILDRPYNHTEIDLGLQRVYSVDEFLDNLPQEE